MTTKGYEGKSFPKAQSGGDRDRRDRHTSAHSYAYAFAFDSQSSLFTKFGRELT